MENFRAGVMDRLGFGYAALSEINPKLIYCAICGFGQTGPERLGAGYDGKIQAMSGIMAITGHAEMGPTRAGFAVCDILSGMTAAFAVSSALFQRTHTGQGQFIDVSMLEATLAFLSAQVADFTVAGHRQEQSGNQAVSRKATANLFKAGGGYLLLAVNNEKQYRALMDSHRPRRRAGRSALRRLVPAQGARGGAAGDHRGRRWQRPTRAAWEARLNAAGAPCASIWRIEEIIDHPQIVARGVMQTVDTPVRQAAADGQRLPAGAWRRPAGQRGAGGRSAHRRGAGGSRLHPRPDRGMAGGRGDMTPDGLDLPAFVRDKWPYAPRFARVNGWRMHYVDEGKGDPVVLLHGNPTWGFLYRDMIGPIVQSGRRVIVPDMIGFGLSEKPAREYAHTLDGHSADLVALLRQLDLSRITLVCHDWGGPTGLSFAMSNPERMRALVVMSTWAWPTPPAEFHTRIFPWRMMHAPLVGPYLMGRHNCSPGGASICRWWTA